MPKIVQKPINVYVMTLLINKEMKEKNLRAMMIGYWCYHETIIM